MFESPSKRQRLSNDHYISRDVVSERSIARSTPTTPSRRASYLSPTKASLARSHPNLLSRSPLKAATAPRTRMQREDERGETALNQASRPNLVPKSAPRLSLNTQTKPAVRTEPRFSHPDATLAADIAQAFKDFPITAERAQVLDLPTDREIRSNQPGGRQPLSQTQPRGTLHDGTWLKPQLNEQSLSLVPRLVTRSEGTSGPGTGQANADVELPPTPVQLGLSAAPDRPRGLASSSSGGSRSGSGRHRRRVRNGESRSITSSPLKPRDRANRSMPSMTQLSADASESEAENGPTVSTIEFSEHTKERQGELAELQKELSTLREDVNKLASLSKTLEHDPSVMGIDDDIREILFPSQRVISHWDATKNLDIFVRLFAPADLQLQHETKTKVVKQHTKVIHTIMVSAPQPWPVSTLSLGFDATVDAKEACIESIVQRKAEHSTSHSALEHWIDQRLQQPLHQYDIGGLVLGVGQYLQACITRAKILLELDRRHNNKQSLAISQDTSKGLSRHEVFSLAKFMDKTQLALMSPSASAQPRRTETTPLPDKQILLTYNLELTWTGGVRPDISISCTGVGVSTQKIAQELFQKLLKTTSIIESFDSIWKLLECDQGAGNNNPATSTVGKGGATGRKGRRKVIAGRY